VRRDSFIYTLDLVDFSELRNDFVNFRNCHSLESETFLSHHTILFGDLFHQSENDSLPRQLKELGFTVRSFCNGDIFMQFPLDGSNSEIVKGPTRKEMILDLGTIPPFDWKIDHFWEAFDAYHGAADDVERQIPEKWREFIRKEVKADDNNFVFLHFFMAHSPYGINASLEVPIIGKNLGTMGKEILSRVERGDLSCEFVKSVYLQRIYDIITIHLRDLINILKEKNIYSESLIIITGDHGEGLGDIGYNLAHLKIRKLLYNSFLKELFPFFNANAKFPYYKFDFFSFYHSGNHSLLKMVPLLIKFPHGEFGGKKYDKMVTLFDVIPTINHYVNNRIFLKRDFGYSLHSLLSQDYKGDETDKLDKRDKIIQNIKYRESLESVLNQRLDYIPHFTPPEINSLYEDLIMGVNDYTSLGPGWYSLENWPPCIRWTSKKGIAYLKRDEKYTQLCLMLIDGIKERETIIYVNNKNSGKYKISSHDFQTIRIPLIDIDEQKYLEVAIEVKKTWIPDNGIKNGTMRSLGMAVQKMWQE